MIKLSWHTNCTTITMVKLSVSSIFSHYCGNCLLLPFDSFIILLNITTCWNTYFGAKHKDIVFGEGDQEWCRNVHITTDPDGHRTHDDVINIAFIVEAIRTARASVVRTIEAWAVWIASTINAIFITSSCVQCPSGSVVMCTLRHHS